MNTWEAFGNAVSAIRSGSKGLVFDWDEAARRIVAAKAQNASAGLCGDWEYTGGEILRDGKPLSADESYTYLASMWATPELDIGNGAESCAIPWTGEGANPNGWGSGTRWPESARKILRDAGYPAP